MNAIFPVMKSTMNRGAARVACLVPVFLSLLLGSGIGLTAQVPAQYLTGSKLGDIALADGGGFLAAFAGEGLNFGMQALLSSDGRLSLADEMLASSMTELSGIPLALSGSPDSIGLSAFGAALWGAESLTNAAYGPYSLPSQWSFWAKNNLTMYRAYDAYASFRLRSPAWDNSGFKRYGYLDLAAASFDPKNLGSPYLWAGVGIASVGVALPYLLDSSKLSKAVWSTGEFYIQDKKVDPAAFALAMGAYNVTGSIYTGIGEESAFRGFLHEELSSSLGRPWAMVVDTGAFALMHLLTDIIRGQMSKPEIAIHVLSVSASNIILDLAYDRGGLALASATHAWIDIFALGFSSLATGGAAALNSGH